MGSEITIVLKDWEAAELIRILADGDAKAALAFLKRHLQRRESGLLHDS
jgi:hypothetical protein